MAAWELNVGDILARNTRATTSRHFGETAMPGGGNACCAPTL
jgi:hypothetical protein